MNKAGLYHHCGDQWCYALDNDTLHIRLKTAADDIDSVDLVHGDPFEWGKIDGKQVWRSNIQPMTKAGTNGVHDFWEIRITPPYKRLKYWFLVHANGETCEFGEKGLVSPPDRWNTWNTFIFPYIQPAEIFHAPEWIADTVWYQIFPERYHNPDAASGTEKNTTARTGKTLEWQHGPVTNKEFYGGNLRGITAKLDHIASLGCNGIYLTPIFESPSVHKYDTADYLKIDPAFGTEDDLRELVAECHKRGIRIILDAVFNHAGTHFAPWQDVLEHGEASRYRNWFVINGFPLFGTDPATGKARTDDGDSHQANFHTFAFTTGMPKLNTSNPEVKDYLLKVATHYIRECDIDGWRLDVANEVDHAFWRAFRAAVKGVKPDAYIVGEIWHHSIDWLRGDQYDAIMNYHFGQAITNFLTANREIPDGRALAERMTTLELSYPLPVIRAGFNLLDSHDTERLLHTLKDDVSLARQAWLLLALLPGSPCFYYGSEYGIRGGHDPDCRRCMPWDDPESQEEGQLDFLTSIIALRKENAVLVNRGSREWLYDSSQPDLFGVRISAHRDTEAANGRAGIAPGAPKRITVLFNRGTGTVRAGQFDADPAFAAIPAKSWAISVR